MTPVSPMLRRPRNRRTSQGKSAAVSASVRRLSLVVLPLILLCGPFVIEARAEGLLDALQSRLLQAQQAVRSLTGARDEQARRAEELRGATKSLADELRRLDEEIIAIVGKLREAEIDLVRLESEAEALESQIGDQLSAVQARADAYGSHLTILYKATRTTALEQILSSRSLGEAVQRMVAMRAVAQVDTRLLGQLRRDHSTLLEKREALALTKEAASARRDEIEASRASLQAARDEHAVVVVKAEAEAKDAEVKLTDYDRQARDQVSAIGAIQQQYQQQLREIERERELEAQREAEARAASERATAVAAQAEATKQAGASAEATRQAFAQVQATQTALAGQARALATVYAQGTVVARQTATSLAGRSGGTPAATRPAGASAGVTPTPIAPIAALAERPAPTVVSSPSPVTVAGSVRTNLLQPSTLGFVWPVTDPDVTTEFGERNFAQSFHTGIDLAKPMETAIRAAAGGIVLKAGLAIPGVPSASYGMMVVVAHGPTLATLYAHLDNRGMPPVVKEGQVVRRGQVLGYIGMTGLTSGPHVHFEVLVNDQPTNPRKYLPSSMG